MKPSWDNAPEWANWLAMDGDGEWWWYESEPEYDDLTVCWTPSILDNEIMFCGGNYSKDPMDNVYAIDSLEPRP